MGEYPYDVSGNGGGDGSGPLMDISGGYYWDDVAGVWNPVSALYRGLQRVPGLNRIPGFRPNRGPRMLPPRGSPQRPFSTPPLPVNDIPPVASMRSTLGLPTLTWGATDAGVQVSSTRLEKDFKAERLVIIVSVTGTPAGATRVVGQFVGSDLMQPSVSNPVPVEMFGAQATYADLGWRICKQGSSITLQLDRTAAPGSGNAVTATIGIYGQFY